MTGAGHRKLLNDGNWVFCKWTPQSSITAYELAQLHPYLHHTNTHGECWISRTEWEAMDSWLKRHMKEVKEDGAD